MELWHGSRGIVKKPDLAKCRANNDFGLGFYCTTSQDLAKEWATARGTSGFASHYELDETGLSVLDLQSPEFSVLNWLAVVASHRIINECAPIAVAAVDYLRKNFYVDVAEYDLVGGYRADDSCFSYVRKFVNNDLTVGQLSAAMRVGELGSQVMLRTGQAFERLRYTGCEQAPFEMFGPRRMERDEGVRAKFRGVASRHDLDGLYMSDILRGEVRSDDERLSC